jgi:hypothetical protein
LAESFGVSDVGAVHEAIPAVYPQIIMTTNVTSTHFYDLYYDVSIFASKLHT